MANFGDGVMQYFAKIGLDTTEFLGGLTKADSGILKFYRDVSVSMASTMVIFDQFVAGAQKGFDITVGAAMEYQDAINDLHNTLGLTNADAQKWKTTLASFDTDTGSFSSALRYLTQRISDAGDEGKNLRAALKGIGVDATDASGNYKDASDIIQEILLKLDKIPAGTQRANKAAEIFGKNWYSIAELIDNGTEAVQKFKDTQPIFSDDELDRIDKAKNKMNEFNEKVDAAQAKIGAGIVGNSWVSESLDVLSGTGAYAETDAKGKWAQAVRNKETKLGYSDWMAQHPEASLSSPFVSAPSSKKGTFSSEYIGMTDAQITLKDATEKLTAAQKDQAAALNQADYDQASKDVQTYANKITSLKTEMASGLTTATEKYTDALKTLHDEQLDASDLTSNFIEDIGMADDTASAISLISNYRRSMRTENRQLATDQANVNTALASMRGEKIKYEITVNLDGKKIATQSGESSGSESGGTTKADLTQAGVRT